MQLLEEIKVPQESVNDDLLVVIKLNKKDGEKVEAGDIVIELETSKTVFTLECTQAGYIQYLCQEGDEVAVNSTIIKIFDEINEQVVAPIQEKLDVKSISKNGVKETLFSQKALQLIEKNGIDQSLFKGMDLVDEWDVKKKLNPGLEKKASVQSLNPQPQKTAATSPLPDNVDWQPLSRNKKREINYLTSVQSSSLVSVLHSYIEIDHLFSVVNPYLRYFKDSLLPLISYELARLLLEYKEFNAFYESEQIGYYENINIGIALDMDNKGLKVGVISDATKMRLKETEERIFELSNKYLDDQLSSEDTGNITFTITDLSGDPISYFQPLINQRNSAILGVGTYDKKLGRVGLSLAFDHRVTEGKKAAELLAALKGRIESYKNVKQTAGAYGESYHKTIICWRCQKNLQEDFSGIGLMKVVTPDGDEGYVCQTCLLGN